MCPSIFYETYSQQAIPLFLITTQEWENKKETFTTFERNCFATQQFAAKSGDVCLIPDQEDGISKAYIGIHNGNEILALAHAATRLPPGHYAPQQVLSHTASVVWSLAQYRFADYKKQDWLPRILLIEEESLAAILAESSAIFLVRDLINKPTNDLSPEELATIVTQLAEKYDAHYEYWTGKELLTANFPAIHTVGRASVKEPRLLSLSWGDKTHPHITLVGKGVCFDSGGLDIKPSTAMRLMKKDMGGAAHAIALARWVMEQKLPVYLELYIPAVENAIGPDAFRPGDVITMRNKLTVEIDNTDAEGRLVLADALVKACEEKPDLLIDFATLTGAARVAVGTDIAAMFCNDETLAQLLMNSSLAVNDPVWRLPLFEGYESMLDSSIADLANASASSYAGAISAALFLQRFVAKKVSWVHFDIMAWNVSSKPGKPEGGEAMALRALMHYLRKTYSH
ncbi:leucyl aminopeptidase family protein [Legionella fairfieldensis]|uniref:leucyl aminopeptidase family protein n=1 Tax=Legionella fairfieldensis TaxID=45064 RepID=UPI00048B2BA9|nr:leucyl aminopeptidase family protein [Legionella fairfieldensis]